MCVTSLALYIKNSAFERVYFLLLLLVYWMKYKFTFCAYTPEKKTNKHFRNFNAWIHANIQSWKFMKPIFRAAIWHMQADTLQLQKCTCWFKYMYCCCDWMLWCKVDAPRCSFPFECRYSRKPGSSYLRRPCRMQLRCKSLKITISRTFPYTKKRHFWVLMKKKTTHFPYAVVFNPAAVNYKAADVSKSD